MPSPELLKAIAITAELCGGTVLSAAAARAMVEELAQHPEADVLVALKRCQRELTGRLSLADILKRLPSGHPGPEEAWAMVAHALGDERETIVLTPPMEQAWWAADALYYDPIAARMAFLEVYRRAVATAGAPTWRPILGWDAERRDAVLEQAVELGRLPKGRVAGVLGNASYPMPANIPLPDKTVNAATPPAREASPAGRTRQ